MKLITVVCVLSLALPTTLRAQESGTGLRPGAWGAELSFDGDNPGLGGALLRYRSDRSAWVLGLDGFVIRQDRADSPFGDDDDMTSVGLAARLGIRSFRSPGSAVRPVLGAGIVGNTAQSSDLLRAWQAGVYGEIGVARFFGPNFSLGAFSDVELTYGERRSTAYESHDMRIGFDILRVTASVIF